MNAEEHFKRKLKMEDDVRILKGNARLKLLENTIFPCSRLDGGKENLEFKEAFSICGDSDMGIRDCAYAVHGREFTDLSCMEGFNAIKIDDEYELREYADGKNFIFHGTQIPTFDSGDREWCSRAEMAVYCDEAGVNMIYCSYGYKIPRIDIYLGLKKAVTAPEAKMP